MEQKIASFNITSFSITSFNVIIFDPNKKEFVKHDIIPYLIRAYKAHCSEIDLNDIESVKRFVKFQLRCEYWSRCEYEMVLQSWPNTDISVKTDIFEQAMMNIDIIVRIFINAVKENIKKR